MQTVLGMVPWVMIMLSSAALLSALFLVPACRLRPWEVAALCLAEDFRPEAGGEMW